MVSEAWTRVDLSREQLAEGALTRIREECCRWYLAARTPPGAQMVSKAPDARRRKRVSAELYFSPTMARICRPAIASYHPVAAKGSPSGEVTLLVGEARVANGRLPAKRNEPFVAAQQLPPPLLPQG